MYVSPVGYLLQVTRTANTEPGADKAMVFTNVALRHRGCISAQPPVKREAMSSLRPNIDLLLSY